MSISWIFWIKVLTYDGLRSLFSPLSTISISFYKCSKNVFTYQTEM